jgi:hypothetical protein
LEATIESAYKELQLMDSPAAPQGANQAYYGVAGQLKQESPEETIDYLFTFHDDPDKTPHYIEIWESAKQFAKVLIRHCPSCADRTTAIRKVREAVMTANAAVALSGRGL